jgi:hypothetical protein
MKGVKALEESERLRAENEDLKQRIAELRDLLGLETTATVATAGAGQLREKINTLSVSGMQQENAERKE